MRKRHPSARPEVNIGSTWLPADLAEQVRALLFDPITGHSRYGLKKSLDLMFWSNWVDSQMDHDAAQTARTTTPLEKL